MTIDHPLIRAEIRHIHDAVTRPRPTRPLTDPQDQGSRRVLRRSGEWSPAPSVVEQVQRRALAEPLQLGGAESMVKAQRLARSVRVSDTAFDGLAWCYTGQSEEAQPIVGTDAVVIRWVLEGQRQQALLFQIGFVYPRKAAGDHRRTSEQARGQCRMLAAAAFAVIAVADGHPFDSLGLVMAGDLGDWLVLLAAQHVDTPARLVVEGIDRAHEHVVAELVEMAAKAQPIPRWRDVVGGGLALGLDQHRHVKEILAVPGRPRMHDLKPL